MIREARIYQDVKDLMIALIQAKITAGQPWAYWVISPSWPNENVYDKMTNPIIVVTDPKIINLGQRYGGGNFKYMSMEIELWNNNETGGPEEINILSSEFIKFFGTSRSVHTQTFDITLSTESTDTNIYKQGMSIVGLYDRGNLYTEKEDQFRKGYNLNLKIHV